MVSDALDMKKDKIDLKVEEFIKLIFEPQHEKGQACWCHPSTEVSPSTQTATIEHNAQKIVLAEKFRDFIYDVSEQLFTAGDTACEYAQYALEEVELSEDGNEVENMERAYVKGAIDALDQVAEHLGIPISTKPFNPPKIEEQFEVPFE